MTATTIRVQMAQRKDTAANWTAANPILLSGEIGYETDTKKFKIGNGSTNWNGLAYLPIPDGSGNLTITGNLEIGSTGSLTFEGSTADGFETTLAVTNPTADRTITLPNQSGTVLVSGNASIVDADISATAEIAVSKLADGAARQLLQTDAAGTGVEWASNIDIPGTLDVTGAATFDAAVTVTGDLTVNGTTTTISTQNLLVEDKNIIIGDVATPTDTTADGGGITLKGTTDKTINWVDATDAWTSSERFSIPLGSAAAPSLTFTGDTNTGIYSPGADQVAISTNGTGRLFVDASGNVSIGTTSTSGFGRGISVDGTTFSYYDLYAEGTILGRVRAGIGQMNVLAQGASTDLILGTQDTERLRITSAGLVGVGTSSFTPRFAVNNSVSGGGYGDPSTYYAAAENTGVYGLTTINSGSLTANKAQAGVVGVCRVNASGTPGSGNEAYGVLGIASNGYGGGVNTFGIGCIGDGYVSGRLGIGTTGPQGLLHLQQSLSDSTPIFALGETSNIVRYSIIQESGYTGISHGNQNIDLKFKTYQLAGSGGAISFWTGVSSASERARIDSSGRLLVGTSSDSGGALLQVNGNRIRIATAKTPASATDTGTAGEICWDANYIYVCTATNTWKRTAISTW